MSWRRFWLLILLRIQSGCGLWCVQCSSAVEWECAGSPGPPAVCESSAASSCLTRAVYTPNLQDDSDANFDDEAGRRLRLERGCAEDEGEVRVARCEDAVVEQMAVVECRDYCSQAAHQHCSPVYCHPWQERCWTGAPRTAAMPELAMQSQPQSSPSNSL